MKVMFVDRNGELTPYFGIVRFYFSVTIVVQQKPVTHYLAYVTWLKFKWSSPDPVSHLHGVSNLYQRERIISQKIFVPMCSCAYKFICFLGI